MTFLTIDSVFSFAALDILANRANESLSVEDFFREVDEIAKDPEFLLKLPTPIEFSDAPTGDSKKDGDNAALMLESIGYLNPADAADPRLWSFLALVTLREFMEGRWPLESKEDWRNQLLGRWLLRKTSRRSLLRHGIARLWWVAALTHDADQSKDATRTSGDSFAYTRWVFENQNRYQSIFERQLGSIDPIRWAILEVMYKSTLKGQTAEIKRITKELHLESGFRHLDVLDHAELVDLIEQRL
ncbi:hypothetical protein CDES_05620 [Corynebacterium deserti GIMN1.010]|uniref:Uncharacterized protein n=1 Tax=Corynebacterium deserti GIMN1.010 TaxID=931089 RepID=A0A0M4CHW2_9CORY|nr:DUF6339 family protein [Corynebacterium deserti]ALC05558.1 hypothetical protein CDES_05620 [Corynebacterium deserti GIMN1.010]